jgi:hypothetical protein
MDGDRVDPLLRPMVRGALKYFNTRFNPKRFDVIKLANKGYSEKDMQHLILMQNTYVPKIN